MTPPQAAVPVKPRETTTSDWYRGVNLPAILQHANVTKMTGQVVVHVSQGAPSMIEVRTVVELGFDKPLKTGVF